MSVVYKKSRQVATFEMGLGSSCLEKVVIPYTKFPFDESCCKGNTFSEMHKHFKGMVSPRQDGCICRQAVGVF